MTQTFFNTILAPLIYNSSNRRLIVYMRQKNILKSVVECCYCHHSMKEIKKNNTADGYVFKCGNKQCNYFQTTKSIRNGSFLENYNIKLNKFLHFLYEFTLGTPQKDMVEKIGISNSLCEKLCKNLRRNATMFLRRNPIFLGGPGVCVQIDEAKFNFNVKSHRGRSPREQIWVFGLVDTSFTPAKGFMQVVEARNKQTLMPIIYNTVLPGSIIYSDEWPAYNSINVNYQHSTVCHKFNFVNPETGVHTQNIESYWNKQKNRIKKMLGVKKTCLSDYLSLFVFLDYYCKNKFDNLIEKLLFTE